MDWEPGEGMAPWHKEPKEAQSDFVGTHFPKTSVGLYLLRTFVMRPPGAVDLDH